MSSQIESVSAPFESPAPRRLGLVNFGVFVVMFGLGMATYFTPLKTWLSQGELIKAHLDSFGSAAPWVFAAATALLTALGTPRLLLCSLAGWVFGFAWGLVWSQAGSLLGSYATFLAVRWKGRDYRLEHCSCLRGFSHCLASQGLLAVVLIRQLPVNGFYNTLILGLAPVRHGDFLLGSLLGFLPLGVTACLLGAGLVQDDWLKGMRYLALGLACSVALGYILNCWARKRVAKRDNAPAA